jgi:hypothetical protein
MCSSLAVVSVSWRRGQGHAEAWVHHEARRGQGSGIRDQGSGKAGLSLRLFKSFHSQRRRLRSVSFRLAELVQDAGVRRQSGIGLLTPVFWLLAPSPLRLAPYALHPYQSCGASTLARELGRARAVYSARLHSRGIDSVRGVRPLVPGDGEKSGEPS